MRVLNYPAAVTGLQNETLCFLEIHWTHPTTFIPPTEARPWCGEVVVGESWFPLVTFKALLLFHTGNRIENILTSPPDRPVFLLAAESRFQQGAEIVNISVLLILVELRLPMCQQYSVTNYHTCRWLIDVHALVVTWIGVE